MRSRKGFTLVEVLVVVATLAILIGVAIPAVTSRTERAAEVTDLANVRTALAQVIQAAAVDEKGNVSDTYDPFQSGMQWVSHSDGHYSVYVRSRQTKPGWDYVDSPVVAGVTVEALGSSAGWLVSFDGEANDVVIKATSTIQPTE